MAARALRVRERSVQGLQVLSTTLGHDRDAQAPPAQTLMGCLYCDACWRSPQNIARPNNSEVQLLGSRSLEVERLGVTALEPLHHRVHIDVLDPLLVDRLGPQLTQRRVVDDRNAPCAINLDAEAACAHKLHAIVRHVRPEAEDAWPGHPLALLITVDLVLAVFFSHMHHVVVVREELVDGVCQGRAEVLVVRYVELGAPWVLLPVRALEGSGELSVRAPPRRRPSSGDGGGSI